ncbi:MAG: glycerol kinase GlpK [Candidatus Marinimicrobia bacterium]|nr:glycerol kinase GlpK [Candidatus Neomarinimicrobiota bacterium]MCF7840508.1 glycerol kinase GlpK [Candidatus Neomarinimicrobiota bacterium]
MTNHYILAIDQGTTGTKSVCFDHSGNMVAKAYREFRQIYPQPGWVEHDPEEIWQTVVSTVNEAVSQIDGQIDAVGITNQRETTVVWDRETGKPVYNAIVWQCRRTASFCEKLASYTDLFKQRTGLPIDAYFSGTKIRWILDHFDHPNSEKLAFGTIDTWLIWKLTNGQVHATDFTNASRTLLFDIHKKEWDAELSGIMGVPTSLFPDVKRSQDDFGTVESISALSGVPIAGVAGDQQAALFGQTCFDAGDLKNTYGTGCFLMLNTGDQAVISSKGLITTLATDGSGDPCYALEGSIFVGGAAIQWLRDELHLIENAADSEAAAEAVHDNGGTFLVPAFVGLGAPHWDMDVRGVLVGLTRGVNRNHLIRAALESMAYQTHDVLAVMAGETGMALTTLAVDGGASANNFLMQFQADLSDLVVQRPQQIESTSLGAAYLAGLSVGFWPDAQSLKAQKAVERTFQPKMDEPTRQKFLSGWHHALRQAMTK